ncbi:MAG: 2-amino-4-hydroxy-6-hydroxymethyldihydropteridine diphosphokinase [Saprospiraceae bacterium]
MDQNIYLLLGSNLGNSMLQLKEAKAYISQEIGEILEESSYYETEPWGFKEQASFINQVIRISTEFAPEPLLDKILEIEQNMGRQRNQPMGPREIDIDILFYGDLLYQTDRLTIPHPHIPERSFVLVPMMEIAAEFVHPALDKSIETLYIEMKDESEVILIEEG